MQIFNIQTTNSFIDILCKGIIERFGHSKIHIAKTLVFLPSKRSCRIFCERFLYHSGQKASFIPKAYALGDIDEYEIIDDSIAYENIPDSVGFMEQKISLIKLIREHISYSNIVQSIQISDSLISLFSDLKRHQINISKLDTIVPCEFAEHWQKNLLMLKSILYGWTNLLSEQNKVDPISYRNLILESFTSFLDKNGSEYPIIIAGSTASTIATRKLIKVVSALENGYIILPNIDQKSSDIIWDNIDEYHPQYMIKNLLNIFPIERKNIKQWYGDYIDNDRTRIISAIMCPSGASDYWYKINNISEINNISIIEANNLLHEAKIISCIIRHHIEYNYSCTLVTTNDSLAFLVTQILKKWEIYIDNSIGIDLSKTSTAIFLQLIALVAESNFDPVNCLGLFKHAHFKWHQEQILNLENELFRGIVTQTGPEYIIDSLNEDWFKVFYEKGNDFFLLFKNKNVKFKDILIKHIEFAEKIAINDPIKTLWGDNNNKQLADILKEIMSFSDNIGIINPADYSIILNHLLKGQKYRQISDNNPPIRILTPIEARLTQSDVMILGDLNEGSWPEKISPDPWMNQNMRKLVGLPVQELKIGQSAHDFSQFMLADKIFLTRSNKIDSSPTISSRWILKLKAFAKKNNIDHQLISEYDFKELANNMDMPEILQPISKPMPSPPVEFRPTTLSVTDIEKLIRDPYNLYASKILQLKPLHDINAELKASDFGNFIHNALDKINKSWDSFNQDNIEEEILDIGRDIIKNIYNRPNVNKIWWPKFCRITKWIISKELKKDNVIYSEEKGSIIIHIEHNNNIHKFSINAKADRIEISDKYVTIVDFKTTYPPTKQEVINNLSVQLPLEGIIALSGGFKNLRQNLNNKILNLTYIHITGNELIATEKSFDNVENLINSTKNMLVDLLRKYVDPITKYIPNDDPYTRPQYNPYDHLSRIKEWKE